jgi:hypothetical protein
MLIIPQHIKWYINSVDLGNYEGIPYNDKVDFFFNYEQIYEGYDPSVNFKQAIRNRLIQLGNQKLAICVSGIDSEIIAREAKDLGLNFELFFLSNWGINDYMLSLCQQLATELDAKLNVISVTREDAFDFAKAQYKDVRVNKPTYLILPMLFSAIPEDYYIICGEGDINKTDGDYQNTDIIPLAEQNTQLLSISNTEISYWIWAKKTNRNGDYYFFSSTKELILSSWNDPLTTFNPPNISNREGIKHLWGDNLIFKGKTTNWDTENGQIENLSMRLEVQAEYNLNKLTTGVSICHVNIERK